MNDSIWNGREPELGCPKCGFKFWKFKSIKAGAQCPDHVSPPDGRGLPVKCDGILQEVTR